MLGKRKKEMVELYEQKEEALQEIEMLKAHMKELELLLHEQNRKILRLEKDVSFANREISIRDEKILALEQTKASLIARQKGERNGRL